MGTANGVTCKRQLQKMPFDFNPTELATTQGHDAQLFLGDFGTRHAIMFRLICYVLTIC